MQTSHDADTLYNRGIRALRDEKDIARGRKLLVQSLRLNPNNDNAWVWLARTAADQEKKLECIDRALQVNPRNPQAIEYKKRITGEMPAFNGVPRTVTASSPTAEKTAAVNELGALAAQTSMSYKQLFQKIVAIGAFLLLVVVLFMAPTVMELEDSTGVLLFRLAALAPVIGVIIILYTIVMVFGARLEIYEKGISRLMAGERRSWLWSDFTDMKLKEQTFVYRKYGVPVYTMHMFTLYLMQNGKTLLKINKDFNHYREATQMVIEQVAPLIFERHYAAYNRGETLKYGKIELDRQGVRQGRKKVQWSEIRRADLDEGSLAIQRWDKRRDIKFDVSDIPNAHVLITLVDKLSRRDP